VELGLTLEEVSPAMARRSGLEEEDVGLLVAEVEPGSFADEIRMLRGDLILEVNRKRVLTLREFRAVQRKLGPGSDVVFWIMRRGRRNWVRLRLGGTLPE
jgi:serine protease Do